NSAHRMPTYCHLDRRGRRPSNGEAGKSRGTRRLEIPPCGRNDRIQIPRTGRPHIVISTVKPPTLQTAKPVNPGARGGWRFRPAVEMTGFKFRAPDDPTLSFRPQGEISLYAEEGDDRHRR